MQYLFKYWQTLRAYAGAHKTITGIVILVLSFAGYRIYSTAISTEYEARYVLSVVTRGTISTSVSGTGQVSAENQVDVKPRASGDVIAVLVVNGAEVKAGQAIARLDARDAEKSVRDAKANLESARISLEKLIAPADTLSLMQAKNSLERAKESAESAADDLEKAYGDAFNSVSGAFIDLPGVMTGIRDLLFSTNAQLGGVNVMNIDFYANTAGLYDARANTFRADAYDKYQAALVAYNTNFQNYKTTDRSASAEAISALLNETYETTLLLADTVKSANNLIQFYEDQLTQHNQKYVSYADTQLATLNSYTSKITTRVSDLLGKKNAITSGISAITSSARAVNESAQSLAKLEDGPDALDIRSTALSVTQRENALRDAEEKLADYVIRVPFSGTIASLDIRHGDPVSSGGAVATLITKEKIAEVELNEVDVAKVKAGERTVLTFDAVEGLSVSGKVSEVDAIGTVSQGVVSYKVKISFDTQDERIKPGMSVSAAIITDTRTDALSVPQSAIKTRGDAHYVEIPAVKQSDVGDSTGVILSGGVSERIIETGISSDTTIEIVSGLSEGDIVITRTISPSAQTTTQSAPSLFGGGGGNRFR
jgi:HlyD family secretion protein